MNIFNLLHLKYSKYKLESEIFFMILPKTTDYEINNLNNGTGNVSSCRKLASKLKVNFFNAIAESLLLSFACNWGFYFNIGKKLRSHKTFSACFYYYSKYLNNDNKIFPLHLLLVSNSTFRTDFLYFGTI